MRIGTSEKNRGTAVFQDVLEHSRPDKSLSIKHIIFEAGIQKYRSPKLFYLVRYVRSEVLTPVKIE